MNVKVIGIVLLIAGFISLIYGLNAVNVVGSSIIQTLTNAIGARSWWFLVTGVVAAIIGLVLTLSNSGKLPKN
jgi:uncharacterized membrane protein HdeD (DUF308 family)